MKFRLLPFLLLILIMNLGSKLYSLTTEFRNKLKYNSIPVSTSFFVNSAFAEQPSQLDNLAETTTENAPPKDEKKEDKNAEPSPLQENKSPIDATQAKSISQDAPNINYGPEEIKLLKELAKRKEELDAYKLSLDERAELIKAAELKLDTKITELKTLKTDLEHLLSKYNEEENKKIKSLVKVYENMKPQDSAKIFNELDLPILLQVVEKMKESKLAPILALMDPYKAKDITTAIAKEKPIQSKN